MESFGADPGLEAGLTPQEKAGLVDQDQAGPAGVTKGGGKSAG